MLSFRIPIIHTCLRNMLLSKQRTFGWRVWFCSRSYIGIGVSRVGSPPGIGVISTEFEIVPKSPMIIAGTRSSATWYND